MPRSRSVPSGSWATPSLLDMTANTHALADASLVSFYGHPTDTATAHYRCAGVVVAPGWVLTVKHLFDDHPAAGLYLRPRADFPRACRILGEPRFHPVLDAALVQLAEPPAAATPVAWANAALDLIADDLALNGFHDGGHEVRSVTKILRFDDQHQHWVFEPKQPKGHSGSGLSHQGRLVGIAVAHYKDPNINSGCALAMRQLADWLREQLPQAPAADTAAVQLRTGRAQVLAALQAAWACLMAHRALRDVDALKAQRLQVDGFTGRLADHPDFEACERAMDAVQGLAKTLVEGVASGSISIDKPQRAQLRMLLTTAMGQAAKLGVDLAALPGSLDGGDPLSVNAGWPVGAMLALRLDPGRCWALPGGGRQAKVIDTQVFEPKLEAGGGVPAEEDYSRETYLRVFPNDPPPADLKQLNRELRSELPNLRREGRPWCALVGSDTGESVGKVPAALQDWARKMGVSIVVLRPDDARSIFLGDEDVLIGRLRRFLQLFDTHQDWPAP